MKGFTSALLFLGPTGIGVCTIEAKEDFILAKRSHRFPALGGRVLDLQILTEELGDLKKLLRTFLYPTGYKGTTGW